MVQGPRAWPFEPHERRPALIHGSVEAASATLTRSNPERHKRRGLLYLSIISHPDAGKTTLTEKLLLFGGAIQLAGEVKARGERRRVRSDWMAIERERGISASSAVMSFGEPRQPDPAVYHHAPGVGDAGAAIYPRRALAGGSGPR